MEYEAYQPRRPWVLPPDIVQEPTGPPLIGQWHPQEESERPQLSKDDVPLA